MIDSEAFGMYCEECGERLEGFYHVIDSNMDSHYCNNCALKIAEDRLNNARDISIDTYSVDSEINGLVDSYYD